MQKFSSFGRKKKQTKIRHRMVTLRRLQLERFEKRNQNLKGDHISAMYCTVLISGNFSWVDFYNALFKKVTKYHNFKFNFCHVTLHLSIQCGYTTKPKIENNLKKELSNYWIIPHVLFVTRRCSLDSFIPHQALVNLCQHIWLLYP